MNSDNIRKAIELADGFQLTRDEQYFSLPAGGYMPAIKDIRQHHKDALAAQLVRQVDALAFPYDAVFVTVGNTSVEWPIGTNYFVEGPNRTDNTINAILESGVLAKK